MNWAHLVGKEVRVTRNRFGYRVNDQYFRRVTTLLQGLPKPALTGWAAKSVATYAVEHKAAWTGLPDKDAIELLKKEPIRKRDDAGDRGGAIHAAIEAYIGDASLPDMTEDEFNCAIAAEAFLRRYVDKVLGVETSVISPRHGYAGTFDIWFLGRDGALWTVDWKSSGGIYTDHAVQLAAYRNAEYAITDKKQVDEEEWTGRLLEWGPGRTQRLGIVHVRPDGATLHPVAYSDRLWTVFRAAAHVKLFQLDTDSWKKKPREAVFEDPVEIDPAMSAEPAA